MYWRLLLIDFKLEEQVEEAWVPLETFSSYSNRYDVSFVELLISTEKLLPSMVQPPKLELKSLPE